MPKATRRQYCHFFVSVVISLQVLALSDCTIWELISNISPKPLSLRSADWVTYHLGFFFLVQFLALVCVFLAASRVVYFMKYGFLNLSFISHIVLKLLIF